MSPPSVARDPGSRTQAQGLLPPPEGLLLDAATLPNHVAYCHKN